MSAKLPEDERKRRAAARMAAYAATHREQTRETSRRWRRNHPDDAAKRSAAAYAKDRDRLIALKRVYNAQRRDEINAKSRAWSPRSENCRKSNKHPDEIGVAA